MKSVLFIVTAIIAGTSYSSVTSNAFQNGVAAHLSDNQGRKAIATMTIYLFLRSEAANSIGDDPSALGKNMTNLPLRDLKERGAPENIAMIPLTPAALIRDYHHDCYKAECEKIDNPPPGYELVGIDNSGCVSIHSIPQQITFLVSHSILGVWKEAYFLQDIHGARNL